MASASVNSFASRSMVVSCSSSLVAWWHLLMELIYFFYFLMVPYMLAFLRNHLLTTYANALYASYAADCLLLVDLMGHFNVSFIDERSVEVFDRGLIRQHYMQGDFFIDFIGVLPLDILARFVHLSGTTICWLRTLKLIHLPKFVRLLNRFRIHSSRITDDFHVLYLTAMAIIHVLACIWFGFTEVEPVNYQSLSGYHGFGDFTNGSVRS